MYKNNIVCASNDSCINLNTITSEQMIEITNRYTPPTDASKYLREQGYCVHEKECETIVEDLNISSEHVQHDVQPEDILIDLTEEDCIAEFNDEMIIQNDEVKFIITVPPRLNSGIHSDYVAMCKNHQILKKNILKHLFDDTPTANNRIVVQGTPDDIKVVMAEIRCRSRGAFV